jgi:hypothetical protein
LPGSFPTSSEARRRSFGWFLVWVGVGFVGTLGILVFGTPALVLVGVLAILMARRFPILDDLPVHARASPENAAICSFWRLALVLGGSFPRECNCPSRQPRPDGDRHSAPLYSLTIPLREG